MALINWTPSPKGTWDWYDQQLAAYNQAQADYQKQQQSIADLTRGQTVQVDPQTGKQYFYQRNMGGGVIAKVDVPSLSPFSAQAPTLTAQQETQRQRDLADAANASAVAAAISRLTAGDTASLKEQATRYKANSAQIPLFADLDRALSELAAAKEQDAQARATGGGVNTNALVDKVNQLRSQVAGAAYKPSLNLNYGSGPRAADLYAKLGASPDKNSPEYQAWFQQRTFEDAQAAKQAQLSNEVSRLGGFDKSGQGDPNYTKALQNLNTTKAYGDSETARLQASKTALDKKLAAAKEAGVSQVPAGLSGFNVLKPKSMTISQPLNSNTIVGGMSTSSAPSQTNRM